MILTTTNMIEGRTIRGCPGFFVRDVPARITGIAGRPSDQYQSKRYDCYGMTSAALQQDEVPSGVDSVVGMEIDNKITSDNMMMVSASKTTISLG